jgi:hypothetical protein
MKVLTEQQWWTKARRHQEWEMSYLAKMAALEERIAIVDDILLLHEIIDRAVAIDRRMKRLRQIMARHLERAPDQFVSQGSTSTPHGRLQ